MRRILIVLTLAIVPALASNYVGFRVDLAPDGGLWYKVMAERTLADFTILDKTARMTAGVEFYNESGGGDYLTFYTGYEVDFEEFWIQLRVQGDARVPDLSPRFRLSLLGGFYW